MSIGPELIIASISAAFSVLLTAIVSYIAWRGKDHIREVERNTQFRRFMTGAETLERDKGQLSEINERFDEMRAERKQEHAETREQLEEIEERMAYLTQFIRNIGSAINRSDLDDGVYEPEEFDRPKTWRGGSSEGSDD
jgi:TolA-binding protein